MKCRPAIVRAVLHPFPVSLILMLQNRKRRRAFKRKTFDITKSSSKEQQQQLPLKEEIVTDDVSPFRIGRDRVKGRVLIATKNLDLGHILFNEDPLVAGSWHDHRCIECHEVHRSSSCLTVRKRYPAAIVANLKKIESLLTKMTAIGELDRARALIKALNLCRQKPAVLEQILQCSTENLNACRKCVARIQRSDVTSAIIPDNVTTERAAAILSVLNTNSHELGEWGGSGLFPLACVMEHSCIPNCNFTAHGKQL
jgi:hypothetical protein